MGEPVNSSDAAADNQAIVSQEIRIWQANSAGRCVHKRLQGEDETVFLDFHGEGRGTGAR